MTRLAPGAIVDGFVVEARVHAGAMAELYRVRYESGRADPGFPMVMKVPRMGGGEGAENLVGFEVEQQMLQVLEGPHVPRFVAAGNFEHPYIVMEFVVGRSVKSLLESAPLPPTEVAAIGARIAFALHELHRQHVVHLDLKPSNVILRDSGEAALIDFGLSRHDQLPDLVAEDVAGPVGTGPYVSPEQLRGDRSDPRSDLFALGVILYFLATDERPFGDPQTMREWRRRLWRDPLPPRSWIRDFPPWLQEIILRCLEVDPNARYATAAQLAFDLQHPERVPLTARASRRKRSIASSSARPWIVLIATSRRRRSSKAR